MTRTLSTLMGSGVQLVDALGLVTEMMGMPWLSRH